MASRENQRYLIAIIVLSLFVIVFFITTLLGWSKVYEYSDIADAANAKLKLAEGLQEVYAAKSEVLETMIGGSGGSVNEIQTTIDSLPAIARKVDSADKSKIDAVSESVKQVKEFYDQDMKSNSSAGGGEDANMTYKSLIANLNSVLAKQHNELIVKTDQNAAYRIATDAKLEQVKSDRAAIQANLEQTQKQLENEKNASLDKERELKDKMASQQETLEKSQDKFKDDRDAAEQEKNQLVAKNGEITRQLTNLKEKVDVYETEFFDLPDGKIVKVNQALNNVVLNIGRADGLRVNRSFAVYSQTVNNFEKGQHKATIEVTRLIGEKIAEAKITFEDPLDPILTNDLVLSPTWDPGYSTPFAVAGVFDLDGDGRDDRDKVIQLIRRNGGTVKVTHDDQGNISGDIDPSVRYLVMGTAPVEGVTANPEIVEAMKVLEEQARLSTVQVIDQRKLLNWMGRHGRPKVQTLGGNKAEGAFPSRTPDGSDSKGSGSKGSDSKGSDSKGSGTR